MKACLQRRRDRPPTLLVWSVQDCAPRSAVPAKEMSAVTLPRGYPGEFDDQARLNRGTARSAGRLDML